MTEVSDKQLRDVGFTPAARLFPRDEVAMRLLCAFCGAKLEASPPGWWFHPNPSNRDAWRRVATEAEKIFSEGLKL